MLDLVEKRASDARRRRGRPAPLDSRAATDGSFTVRAAALAVLEAHRAQLASSRECLARSRALCARLQQAARAAGDPAAVRGPRCTFARCGRPATLQPVFAVDCGDTRALVRDLPLRVCAEHRGDLEALFRRTSVLEAVRRKLRARGRAEPDAVRVLFQVVC